MQKITITESIRNWRTKPRACVVRTPAADRQLRSFRVNLAVVPDQEAIVTATMPIGTPMYLMRRAADGFWQAICDGKISTVEQANRYFREVRRQIAEWHIRKNPIANPPEQKIPRKKRRNGECRDGAPHWWVETLRGRLKCNVCGLYSKRPCN